jgi:hypothetical protein
MPLQKMEQALGYLEQNEESIGFSKEVTDAELFLYCHVLRTGAARREAKRRSIRRERGTWRNGSH